MSDCLNKITLTELDNDVAHDAHRTFSGKTSAEKRAELEIKTNARRANWIAVLQVAGALLAAAFILALFPEAHRGI